MTNKATDALDWNAVEERAREMSTASIYHAIQDIRDTLPHADALDREDGGNRGGYYRDESSVLHAELRRRQEAR
jgi:hypothetical protein